jgi:hypothetical protein
MTNETATSGSAILQRVQTYRPSKVALFWACVASIGLTILIGFTWGGWVTGGSAAGMAKNAADDARAELAATVCVERFLHAPDAQAKLTTLKATSSWERDTFIEKGGWVNLPGLASPVSDSAELCAQRLAEAEIPSPAASTQSGSAPTAVQ